MRRYKSHGATDVTGFGLMGHAENLSQAQISEVDLVIDALPIIQGCDIKVTGMHDFEVTKGYSAETSGGILTMMPPAQASEFIKAAEGEFGQTTWVVGKVTKGTRKTILRKDVQVISVRESPFKH